VRCDPIISGSREGCRNAPRRAHLGIKEHKASRRSGDSREAVEGNDENGSVFSVDDVIVRLVGTRSIGAAPMRASEVPHTEDKGGPLTTGA
jgi:hypothetical protein